MGWREDMIATHTEDIKRYNASIRAIDEGKFDIGSVSASGAMTSTAQQLKDHYVRIIDELERINTRLAEG